MLAEVESSATGGPALTLIRAQPPPFAAHPAGCSASPRSLAAPGPPRAHGTRRLFPSRSAPAFCGVCSARPQSSVVTGWGQSLFSLCLPTSAIPSGCWCRPATSIAGPWTRSCASGSGRHEGRSRSPTTSRHHVEAEASDHPRPINEGHGRHPDNFPGTLSRF